MPEQIFRHTHKHHCPVHDLKLAPTHCPVHSYADVINNFSTQSYTIAYDLLLLWMLLPINFKDENIF